MTNAGRILILAKGAWDATSTYEQLDLVTYNQIAYIARKMSTGVNPAADLVYEYWMPFGSAAEIATTERAGLVMPDGTTITITERGLISANLGLDDLTNVDVALPLTNQVLRYNGTEWVAVTLGAAADKATTNAVTQDSTALVESGAVYTETSALSESISTLGNNNDAMLNVLGAKNVLPNNATSQTVSGVTFTKNSDGSITAQGTPQATISFVIDETFVGEVGKIYTLTGCPSGGSDSTYLLASYLYGNTYDAKDIGEGADFTVVGGKIQTRIIIYAAAGSINLTFKPMIRPIGVQDSTYVPYAMTNRELTNAFNAQKVIVVEKTATIQPNTQYTVNLSNDIPSGYAIKGVLSAMLSSYVLPYSSSGSIVTKIRAIEGSNVIIENANTTWTNYTVRLVVLCA